MDNSNSIGLEGLILVSSNGFSRFCRSEISSIKERVDGCISSVFETVIPLLWLEFGKAMAHGSIL